MLHNQRWKIVCRPIFLAGLAVITMAGAGPSVAQTTNKAAVASELAAKVVAAGSVPVIVWLDIDYKLEADLAGAAAEIENSAAVADQRVRIAAAQAALVAALAGTSFENVKYFAYTPQLAVTVGAEGLEVLRNSGAVVSIEEDVAVPPTLWQSIPLIGCNTSTGCSGYTGSGQTVAILDSGVQKTHPAHAGNVVSEACYSTTGSGGTALCTDGSTAAGSGVNCAVGTWGAGCEHGTHVAGIAAANPFTTSVPSGGSGNHSGVARNASIIAIQVFSGFTSTTDCGVGLAPCVLSFTSDQLQGLQRVYALRNTYDIAAANMSIGGGSSSSFCDTDSRKATIDLMRAAGIATVISSGNNGFANATGAPGCISSAITVGSTTKGDAVSSFSNNSQTIVDVLAPGSAIRSTVPWNTYGYKSGTSMAAPHVTGCFAVIASKNPNATVTQIENALESTGPLISSTRSGITQTKRRIDCAAAANAIALPTCTVYGKIIRMFVDARGVGNDPWHYIYIEPVTTDVPGYYYYGRVRESNKHVIDMAKEAQGNETRKTVRATSNSACPTSGTARYIGDFSYLYFYDRY